LTLETPGDPWNHRCGELKLKRPPQLWNKEQRCGPLFYRLLGRLASTGRGKAEMLQDSEALAGLPERGSRSFSQFLVVVDPPQSITTRRLQQRLHLGRSEHPPFPLSHPMRMALQNCGVCSLSPSRANRSSATMS
jgi:hypothetical protein